MSHRVLFCTLEYFPGQAGGAEHQARLQAEELIRRGYEITVVCPRSGGQRSGEVNGVFVRRLPRISRHPFRTVSYLVMLVLYLLIRLRRYELAHVHLANLHADVVVLVGALLRRPVYVKVATGGPIGEIGRLRPISWATCYFGLRHAKRVQALSEEIRQDLESLGIDARRVVRIPNGFDEGVFRPPSPEERFAARRHLRLPETAVLILFAGRFARYKGVLDLLEAWTKLAKEDAVLVLVGTSRTDKPVGPLPSLPGLIVHDWSTDITPYHHACDVFVQPSHADGMSNALLEAMASGMSVVATRVGAAEAMIEACVSGLLVEPNRPDQLAAAVARLLHDSDLRARLGREAAQHARARYSIEAVVDRIEAEYRTMVS